MSRFPKVVVVGQGIAGTAAAWRAAELGAAVTVVAAGAGASTLASGALDHTPWEDLVRAARTTGAEPACGPLDEGVFAFAEALGSWRIPRAGDPMTRLATLAGRTRPSRGHDLSLLDLAAIPGGTVAVPRASRAAWDADSLATFWNDDPFVRARGLRFAPIDVALLRYEGEDRIADADLAARHDDPARVAWLAQRLRDAFAREKLAPAAVILGPWLGASAPCAADLTARLGIPALHLPLPLVRPIAAAPTAVPGAVRFLFLGAMIPTKGPHLALEAFARLPAGSATLTLVGPTPAYNGTSTYVDRLRARAQELPGVTMPGQVAPEAVEGVLHAHDVLLFPSMWDENSPLTLREAAAAGLRIIASDIPGVAEVLGDAGARFEVGSARSLQRAMAAEIGVGRQRAPIPPHLGMMEHAARVLAVYAALPARTR